MLYDISVTAEQLKAAAVWATEGENIAPVELLVDDRMLVVSQGDERTAFDTGGEVGSNEYVSLAPLDRRPMVADFKAKIIAEIEGFDAPEDERDREAWIENLDSETYGRYQAYLDVLALVNYDIREV